MQLQIVINLDNDAFKPDPGPECSRILDRLSVQIECVTLEPGQNQSLHDINGNKVGYFMVTQ